MTTQYGPDMINHPPHYKAHNGWETVDVIEAFAKDNSHRAMALKYLCRAGKKNDTVEDLRKAIWWIEREISHRPVERPKARWPEGWKPAEFQTEKYEAPVDVAFTHCEGCHSMVCEHTGACMHKVDNPH